MPGTPTTKWGLVPSAGTDQAMTIDNQQVTTYALIDSLLAPWSTGLLSARPVSTVGSPGKAGRRYLATDVGTWGCEYVDTGTSWRPTSDVVKLAEVTLGSAGTITFSSIPQGFKSLRVEGNIRSTRVLVQGSSLSVVFNGSTAPAYHHTSILSVGATLQSAGASGETSGIIGEMAAVDADPGAFTGFEMYVPGYSRTNSFKTTHVQNFGAMVTGNRLWLTSMEWQSTAAITSMTFNDAISGTLAIGSSLALYGLV